MAKSRSATAERRDEEWSGDSPDSSERRVRPRWIVLSNDEAAEFDDTRAILRAVAEKTEASLITHEDEA